MHPKYFESSEILLRETTHYCYNNEEECKTLEDHVLSTIASDDEEYSNDNSYNIFVKWLNAFQHTVQLICFQNITISLIRKIYMKLPAVEMKTNSLETI